VQLNAEQAELRGAPCSRRSGAECVRGFYTSTGSDARSCRVCATCVVASATPVDVGGGTSTPSSSAPCGVGSGAMGCRALVVLCGQPMVWRRGLVTRRRCRCSNTALPDSIEWLRTRRRNRNRARCVRGVPASAVAHRPRARVVTFDHVGSRPTRLVGRVAGADAGVHRGEDERRHRDCARGAGGRRTLRGGVARPDPHRRPFGPSSSSRLPICPGSHLGSRCESVDRTAGAALGRIEAAGFNVVRLWTPSRASRKTTDSAWQSSKTVGDLQ
jgi:hypothetical protein